MEHTWRFFEDTRLILCMVLRVARLTFLQLLSLRILEADTCPRSHWRHHTRFGGVDEDLLFGCGKNELGRAGREEGEEERLMIKLLMLELLVRCERRSLTGVAARTEHAARLLESYRVWPDSTTGRKNASLW